MSNKREIKELDSINDVIDALYDIRDTSKTVVNVMYAFNGTGKTRISRELSEFGEDDCLCFNAIFQDCFTWDNSAYILNISGLSWIVEYINEQGIQNQIIENFRSFYNDGFIYPKFLSNSGGVIFETKSPELSLEDDNLYTVKISKAEETIFIWSIFYTILSGALDELQMEPDNRSTDFFNKLKHVVIDDPVSSVDDTAIIKISLAIFDLLRNFAKNKKRQNVDFLITTHHALFFNEICDIIGRGDENIKLRSFVLSRNKERKYLLADNTRNIFGYHLFLRNKIEEAIKDNSLGKNHFNMFRVLLEKTKLYFGYKSHEECLPDFLERKEAIRLMNRYSHFSEFEYSELTDREKEIFVEAFQKYTAKFRPEE